MEQTNGFSRYRNIWSPIHCVDPITKLALFIALTFIVFWAQGIEQLTVIFIFVFIVSLFARVKIKTYFRLLILLLPFYIMMDLFYWFAYADLIQASMVVAYLTYRLYIFLIISVIYTSTTKEMDIAQSIEWYITPLRLIKVPTYEISMMIMLAIRFIPLMLEDVRLIMIAQTSRGVNVYNGKLRTRIKGVINSLLPMLVLSFKRSEDISNAMLIRNYEIGKKRSKFKNNKFGFAEIISIIFIIGLIISVVYVGGAF